MCHLAVETRHKLRTCTCSKDTVFEKKLAKFSKTNCNKESVRMLFRLILETCSTDQRHETGRLKHTCTEENVITVHV